MNIFPLLWSLGLSFFCLPVVTSSLIRFVGLNNYIKVLTNDIAAPATGTPSATRPCSWCARSSVQMIVGFLLAHAFCQAVPAAEGILLTLVLTPMMLSVVAVGVFFTLLL